MTSSAPSTVKTLFGLTSCDTCRKARRWLDERGVAYSYHDVRADGVTAAMLERWLEHVDWPQLVNKRSTTWRQLADSDKEGLNLKRAIALCVRHPTLIKRPILEHERGVVVGFAEREYAPFAG